MKFFNPATECDHRVSLRPEAVYYCNKPVRFYALSATQPGCSPAEPGDAAVSLAGFCSLEDANAEPKPALADVERLRGQVLGRGNCDCGHCDDDTYTALLAALIDAYPYPISADGWMMPIVTGLTPEERFRAAVDVGIGLVRENGSALFPDLEQVCAMFGIDTDGTESMIRDDRPHVVMWAGASTEFLDIVDEILRTERHIRIRRTSVDAYLNWRCILKLHDDPMPVIDGEVAKEGYESQHWLPVMFAWTGPSAAAPETN